MEKTVEVGVVILAVLAFIGWLGGGRKWAFRMMLSASILVGLGFLGILLYGVVTDKIAEHRRQKIHECAVARVATAKCTPGTPQFSDLPKGAIVLSKTDKPWADYAEHAKEVIWDVCPAYWLPDSPTSEQENAAFAAAEEECTGEIDPRQKSLHDQLAQYRRDHGIRAEGTPSSSPKDCTKGDVFDQAACEENKKNLPYTDAKLKDGTVIRFPGDLSPEQVKAKVESYRKSGTLPPGAVQKRLSAKACAAKVHKFYPGAYDDLDDATLTKKVLAKYPTYCDITGSPLDFIPDLKGIR